MNPNYLKIKEANKQRIAKLENSVVNDFLRSNLTMKQYNNLYKSLGISKRMLTFYILDPNRFLYIHVMKIAELTNFTFDMIVPIFLGKTTKS
jgi:hypothetical protein